MMMKAPFSIFRYTSYQEYFQDAYEHLHAQDESYSYDKIAVACDLKSRTLARGILKGAQRPTGQQVLRLAEFFGLDAHEQEYLVCLHRFEAAQGSPAAFRLFQRLMRLQKAHSPARNPFATVALKTSVLHMTLLNIFDLDSAPQDPEDVAILLKGRYPISEVETAIQELSDEGFIFKDRGCWKVKERFMKEIDLNTNFFLRRYHNESLKLAYESLHNEETTERYLVGANFSINQKVYPRIISKLNEFLENLIELEGVAGASDAVVHLNMQLMKMTADQPTVPAKKEKTQFTAAKKDSRSNLPEVSR